MARDGEALCVHYLPAAVDEFAAARWSDMGMLVRSLANAGTLGAVVSAPPLLVASFSLLNLAFTAGHSHAWYRRTFPSTYPSERRALIPWLW